MKKLLLFIVIFMLACGQSLLADQSPFQLHTDKGIEYLQKDAFDEAITEFKEALRHNPNNSVAHSNLAFARAMKHIDMFNQQLPLELLAAISKNGEIDLDEFDKLKKEWNNLTEELLILSHKGFKKALELDDNNWRAHYFVGTHYHNTGDLKGAELELKRAIELKPEYTNSYGVLASVYEKMGKSDLAIEYHKKDLEMDPNNEGARRDLALLYFRLGMKKEALKQYEILKQMNSNVVKHIRHIFEPKE